MAQTLTLSTIQILMPSITGQDLIQEFTMNLDKYSWSDLFNLLSHDNNPIVKVIVRAAIQAKNRECNFTLTLERATNRVIQIENSRRKNFVRRTFKKWGLFAISEIIKEYPDYTDDKLPGDLYIKRKRKEKKTKMRFDFRGKQLAKYDKAYHVTDPNSREFNSICERIAALTYADLKRLPIHLTVTLNGEKYDYSFHWNTAESQIKEFYALANKKGITHEELHDYRSITFNPLYKS